MMKLDSAPPRWHFTRGMQLRLPFLPASSSEPPPRTVVPAGPPTGRARLLKRIRRALSTPADLVVTDNRRTMLSTKRRGEVLEVRLHHMFLDAPDEIIEELLSYLAEGDVRASRRIGEFIESNRDRIKARSRRRILLRTSGAHHDLHEIFEELSNSHFAGEDVSGVKLSWGRLPPRRTRRRSIRLGTYTHDSKLVRIHPALDQADVPRFFVAFVVFHELLHHVVPSRTNAGRMQHHPPEFRRRERQHPDYGRAIRWEAKHLERLLSFVG